MVEAEDEGAKPQIRVWRDGKKIDIRRGLPPLRGLPPPTGLLLFLPGLRHDYLMRWNCGLPNRS